MNEPDVMVYLMTGFLDSGKTGFLKFTLKQDYFQIDGKTTTKDMIYSVLSRKYITKKTEGNYNNHIGLPFTILQLDILHLRQHDR